MRIFLASDIHGARAALSELPARALLQGADIIVLAGDISHRGKPRGFIEELVAGFRGLPVLAVPGNLGVVTLRRLVDGRAEFLMVSFWESEAAVRAFAGPDIERAVFYPEDDRYLVDRDLVSYHYEVVAAPEQG